MRTRLPARLSDRRREGVCELLISLGLNFFFWKAETERVLCLLITVAA